MATTRCRNFSHRDGCPGDTDSCDAVPLEEVRAAERAGTETLSSEEAGRILRAVLAEGTAQEREHACTYNAFGRCTSCGERWD